MKNALVTGGAGFVGRAFTNRLLRDGCRVTVIDNLCANGSHAPTHHPELAFMKCDVRDWFRCTSYCEFDTVFHLAAVVGGRLKIEGDPLAVATDLSIDAEFFNWLARVPEKPQAIYFSSSAAYPIWRQHEAIYPQAGQLEETQISWPDLDSTALGIPDMTYGWAKLTGEYLAQFAAKTYGIDVKIYRPFSGYGPGQSLDYPFPSIINRVLSGENPVTVWGSGEQLRDFIYIDDVVEAVLQTKDKLAPGEALNLGSGVGISFRELAQRAAQVLGREVTVVNDASKPEGVFARVADVTKFGRFYTPKVGLEEGIRRVATGLTTGQE